jgi:hypothetical protein
MGATSIAAIPPAKARAAHRTGRFTVPIPCIPPPWLDAPALEGEEGEEIQNDRKKVVNVGLDIVLRYLSRKKQGAKKIEYL